MRVTKVTTKMGDKGNTLLCGIMVPKTHGIIDLIGELDELNVLLGDIQQTELQNDVFDIGASLYQLQDNTKLPLNELEVATIAIVKKLPPLKEFVLPSGSYHLARAVCRRCERKAWALDAFPNIAVFLNRMSDYLFALARLNSKNESQWNRRI